MPAPLIPASLAFAADGTPYSEAYGDVYHSAAGGLGQARHVFLGGNSLPERWRGRERFVILETGFGLGLNFLATWQAWRDDPKRCSRLHFVSVEAHPFSSPDLGVLHAAYPELAPLSAQLRAAWPLLVPGVHRLEFERGNVVLTLAFADVCDAVPQLRMAADAIYLDGFAPANNPAMWSHATMRAIARRSATGATAATWSASAAVRGALAQAGFDADKRAGYANKREMTCARLASLRPDAGAPAPQRRALVVGAGLAGGAVCERLVARGWEITLIERRAAPALETSGNHAGVFHPLVSPDDNLASRLTRAAFTWWLGHWRRLEAAGVTPQWSRCGVLQLSRDADESIAQRAAIGKLGYPPEYVRWLDRVQASDVAGMPVATGGAWFEQAGWVRPRGLVNALLATCVGLDARFNRAVAALDRRDGQWVARDALGAEIARAPVVVLANADEALTLVSQRHLALRRVRGQETHLPGDRFANLRAVLLRAGYVIPPVAGVSVTGASFDLDDDDPALRTSSHAGNLERLERIAPGSSAGLDPATLEGRVGFRSVARDRLPVIGAFADDAQLGKPGPLAAMPRMAGLHAATAYGSRGILWAGLAAELLASALEGEPLPVEGPLADAVDPARFAQRALRREQRPR